MDTDIAELLRRLQSDTDAPTLARLEDTLTAGYARALALEAERLRLERRLTQLAHDAGEVAVHELPQELAAVSERLTTTDSELVRLRSLLGALRDRARTLRGTVAS